MTSRTQAASNRSNSDGSFLIRIRGLPFTTTKQEILDFFEGINIVSGEDGIHLAAFGLHSTKPLGEAYIELASEDDYEKAQDFHKKTMGSRYIEVLATTYEYFQNIMSEQQHVSEGNVLRLRGIPWSATEQEISEFFKDLQIIQNNGIHIDYDRSGRVSGEAFVHFTTSEDCEKALNLNMQKLGHRYIEIFRSSEQQMNRSIQLTNQIFNSQRMNRNTRMNGNMGNNRVRPYARNEPRDQKMRRPFQTNQRNTNGGGGFNGNNRNFSNSGYNGNDQFSNNQNQFQFDSNGGNQYGGGNGFDNDNFNNRNYGGGDNGFGNNGNSNGGNGGGGGGGAGGSGNWNTRFNGNQSGNNDDQCIQEKCCIHMRGLPYSANEMDVLHFFQPLQPSFCKIILKKNGLHSGEAKAYFNTFDETQLALRKDGQRIGSRYIELFFAGNRGGNTPNVRF